MDKGVHGTAPFIGYEYKDILVKKIVAPLYADGYANFGWVRDDTTPPEVTQSSDTVRLKFKRDRKLCNKAELCRLQRQFDACAEEISTLEARKTKKAMISAFSAGIVGTACMAGAVFAYLGGLPLLVLVCAAPGFAGWIAPYFLFQKFAREDSRRLAPLIEQNYDEAYSVCERANGLLNG